MQSALVISPSPVRVDGPHGALDLLEIDLAGEPSGMVFVLCDTGTLVVDAAETMNGLAGHGYSTVAVDLFRDLGTAADERAVDELGFLLDRAVAEGWETDQIGIVGFGSGARTALVGAMAYDVGAAVSVGLSRLGSIRPVGGSPQRRTPWLGMFGERDADVTSAEILALYGHLLGYSSAFVSIVTYAAGPDFYRDSSDPAVHGAAFDSWQRTVEWLQLRVTPRLTPLALKWRARVSEDAIARTAV